MGTLSTRTLALAAALALVAGGSTARAGQASAKIDVTGKWTFTVTTSAGSGTPTFTFKQDGEKLTGHYSGQLGEADLTGTVNGKEISFQFGVDFQGTHLDVAYAGTVESADSIKGKVRLGEMAEGTFTGKRSQ